MVALFSTLLSNNSNEGGDSSSSSNSSSLIPTVIQLYSSTLLTPSNTKALPGHAILSYQAIQVPEDAFISTESSTTEEASTLFARRQTKTLANEQTPNLGVWNCRVSPLMDSLLHIPSSCSSHYVVTVNLSDPTSVEPDLTSMQQALVRHLIATLDDTTSTTASSQTTTSTSTTTLQQLSNVTFGLAPEDTSAMTTSVALEESHGRVAFHLMICVLVDATNKNLEYEATQAQNLVVYHLHRFAASLGATLVFCQTTANHASNPTTITSGDEQQPQDTLATLNSSQVAHVWRAFANDQIPLEPSAHDAIHKSHDAELIETVFLRNANHPPAWNSSTDSLWKALPAKEQKEDNKSKPSAASTSGDDEWLQQLRDSIASLATEPTAAATPLTSSSTTPAKQQTEDAEVSSFFENLLKK